MPEMAQRIGCKGGIMRRSRSSPDLDHSRLEIHLLIMKREYTDKLRSNADQNLQISLPLLVR